VKRVKPLYEENFYNLSRNEKYEMLFKKSLEIYEFIEEKGVAADMNHIMKANVIGAVLGPEKILFTLHTQAFRVSIDLWSTDEQRHYWLI
jgi:hypothetical protein